MNIKKVGTTFNVPLLEICGLSTDEKPIKTINEMSISNGSIFTEIDTGIKYKYSIESNTWIKQP